MLRDTKDDEGCDSECGMCGSGLHTGRCWCGWVRPCDSCDREADSTFWNDGLVYLCYGCAALAFEQQNDDAKGGM